MKKLFCVSYVFLSLFILYAEMKETDVSVYNELYSAYSSGFYPGAVQYAQKLEAFFPNSAFIGSALALKGESLVRLQQYDAAGTALEAAVELSAEDSVLRQTCVYWLGRVFDASAEYDRALSLYHDYCSLAGESGQYYSSAILNAGRIYRGREEFHKAVPLFEYAVQNGKKYTAADYSEAVLKLFESYNKSGQPEKTVRLFEKYSPESLPHHVYCLLMEYTGDAYSGMKQYRKAYDLYCGVLSSGEKSLVSNALKKAYNISAAHRREVGTDPGNVLKSAQDTLADSPELVSEFWTRLGADAYHAGDFDKAQQYFDEAEKNALLSTLEFIAMYRAQIAAGRNMTAQTAAAAENILLAAQQKLNLPENSSYSLYYNILLTEYAAIQEHWEDVKKHAAKIPAPDNDVKYNLALAYYRTGNYSAAAELLKDGNSPLYALSLAEMHRMRESAGVFGLADKETPLDDNARLDYAKVLLYSGRYAEAKNQAAACRQNEAKYILGLAQFNTGSWKEAESSFSAFIRNGSSDKKSLSYALFYCGYAQYKRGQSKEAYANLSAFAEEYPSHELVWNASIAAANAAVQNGQYDSAVRQAEKAVRTAPDSSSREESVLLCAGIHVDAGAYDKAVALLEPYSKLRTDFGMNSMYQIAQIYEKQGLIQQADEEYKKLTEYFSGQKLAEESMYRRGELYYTAGQYSPALDRFNSYTAEYPGGSFLDAAWYFSADCHAKNGNVSRAILQNQALIKTFPDSTYVYSAAKNLMELYRKDGDYASALDCARLLLQKYGDQARSDGIAEKASELEKLAGGAEEAVVKKASEYEAAGRLSTAAGRRAGTELASLYASSPVTVAEGERLAEQILAVQKKNLPADSIYAAQNAALLGRCYRLKERNKESADMYLLAAEYYRMNGRGEESAAALYGAADAFRAAGLADDADETAKTLKSLYPESPQAKNIKVGN